MKNLPVLASLIASLILLSSCGSVNPVTGPTPIVVTPSSAPSGSVGLPYSLTMNASGGQSPYAWSVSVGALPSGLNLDPSSGVMSGVPAASGMSSFTVEATDSSVPARTGTVQLSLTISAQLAFTTTTLPNGTAGTSYSATASASGGTPPYTWSVSSGSLPSGLTLNSSTGAITGTPASAGSYNFALQVMDSSVPAQTAKLFGGMVVNSPLVVTTTVLGSGAVGVAYSSTLASTGGVNPVSWPVTAGALPAGLSLGTNGVISGTPTAAGNASFTATVADSASPVRSTSQALTLAITHFTILSSAPPTGTVGVAYSFTPTVSGGTAPYAWSFTNGALPAGLSFNSSTGAITGTPSTAGTSSFVLQATDSSAPSETATYPTSITIAVPMSITSTTLPNGVVGSWYTTTLTASNAVQPVTWSVTIGALPSGLTLDPNAGTISGVPSGTGTTNFTIQAMDSSVPARSASAAVHITTNSALVITPGALPDATTGIAYSTTLATTGGVGPVSWSISAGALPGGMSIGASTGSITGTCPGSGTYNFTVRAMDSSSPSQTATLAETIHVYGQLSVTTSSLPDGVVGNPYNATLQAFGGTGTYTWSIGPGTLPDGITLDPSSGNLTGTPTTSGQVNFTVGVGDTGNPQQSATLPLSINVDDAGPNDRLMKGSYALLLQGFDPNGPLAIAGSIDADGAGTIIGGTLDVNRTSGVQTNVAVESGTFAIGSDDRGTVTIQSALGAQTFQVALNAAGTLAHFIESDATGPDMIRGNGVMSQRDPNAVASSSWSGSYALGFSGFTPTGQRSAIVGNFSANETGAVSGGMIDRNAGGRVRSEASVLPVSNYAFEPSGRGTLSLVIDGSDRVSGIVYVVSANRALFMTTGSVGTDLLSGEIRQQANPTNGPGLSDTSVFYLQGMSGPGSAIVAAGVISGASGANLSGFYDSNCGGTITSTPLTGGSFAVTSPLAGRAVMQFAGNELVVYRADASTAFVMDATGYEVKTGMLEGQAATPSLSLPSGEFAKGTIDNVDAAADFESGVVRFAPTKTLSGASSVSLLGSALSTASTPSDVFTAGNNGRITTPSGSVYYQVSSARLIEIDLGSGESNLGLSVLDQ